MILFHASPFIIESPEVRYSRDYLDFGKGFYLTSLYAQAEKYAQRFLLRGKKAYINEYLLDDNLPGYIVKRFECYNVEWLEYVGKCRKGIIDTSFDIVSGGIANDKVFNTIDLYFAGEMSKEDALGRLAFIHPNHQLCILNQKVIQKHLRFVKATELTTGDIENAGR